MSCAVVLCRIVPVDCIKNKAKCCQNLLLKELFFVHLGCSVASVINETEPKFSVPSSEKN